MYLGDAVACTAPKRVTPVRQRDAQSGIGGHPDGWKSVGGQKVNFSAKHRGASGQRGQRPDDAIHLRVPSVGRNQYPHGRT